MRMYRYLKKINKQKNLHISKEKKEKKKKRGIPCMYVTDLKVRQKICWKPLRKKGTIPDQTA
jgi:hypothetical protein